jgi:hypothetical protein
MLPSSLTLPDKFRDLAIIDLDICLSLRICVGQQSGSYNSDTRDSVEKKIDQDTETLACILNVQICLASFVPTWSRTRLGLNGIDSSAFLATWSIT